MRADIRAVRGAGVRVDLHTIRAELEEGAGHHACDMEDLAVGQRMVEVDDLALLATFVFGMTPQPPKASYLTKSLNDSLLLVAVLFWSELLSGEAVGGCR